ncbi:DUF3159 domain-containing protein [Georgenia sp. TF02-10]|uniref:DUF3159 domain-containing protein n=1 Tax=Georgenia sp. TF02-10 TaxID=2917725 RepID=UPI001FA7B366|nr:DUF3159 domain-containing protein [Georgenia sp. TF02-10]UNX53380.1 DUF3159 domain-containing protein [Georgenia sp. TF02-10]
MSGGRGDGADAGPETAGPETAEPQAAGPSGAEAQAADPQAPGTPGVTLPGGPGAPAGALGQLTGPQFSLADSVGGVRGLVESMAPGAVFVVVFVATRELVPPLVASLAVAVVSMALRLIQRTPPTQAVGGLLGVAVGVVWAWQSGRAENYFAMGLWTNAAYAAGLLLALAARWPAVGVVVALLRGQDMSWRTDPAQRGRRARYTWATWLWVAMFGARLLVQVPLYLHAEVAWLGTARLVMGLPLWGLTLWLTWVLVRERAAPAGR